MLNENLENEEKCIPIRMFLDLDEDNQNEYKININELFERED